MATGVAITLSDDLVAVLAGLVIATAGFFGAHSVASGWTGQSAPTGKAQASSLYNLFYYGGSSAVGWFGGVAFDAHGWSAVAVTILSLTAVAAVLAALFLRDDQGSASSRYRSEIGSATSTSLPRYAHVFYTSAKGLR